MLSIGTQPDRIQALINGVVDAADLSHPADTQAERKGFRILWDAKQEVAYPSMSIVTRRKWVAEDRDTVMRMVKAHVEAIHYLKANKEFSMKVLGKYLKTNDRELLESSYEIYRKDFISVPYPITQGLQPTYEYVAAQRPEIWNQKPEAFMDSSFIAELEKTRLHQKSFPLSWKIIHQRGVMEVIGVLECWIFIPTLHHSNTPLLQL